jgi:two-component system, LytTR family, response regulator
MHFNPNKSGTILNTLIIEDEAPAQYILKELIKEFCPQLNVVGVCGSVQKAIPYFSEFEIDLILLDIHLGNENGFQLFDKKIPEKTMVIFLTAHAEYALKAFEVEALDYLLKPIDIDALKKAVDRALIRKNLLLSQELITEANKTEAAYLTLSDSGKIHKIDLEEVYFLKAERVYTKLYLKDGSNILASRPLNYFEAQLQHHKQFLRVHRSYLINTDYLKTYIKKHQTIEMQDNTQIPVSRDKKGVILQYFT